MQDLPRELDDADSLTRRVSHQHAFLQASRRLAQGPAADTELLGQFRLADACPWSQLARDDGLCQVRNDAVRERLIGLRSEEHTSELQSLMRISYAVFCLKKKKTQK